QSNGPVAAPFREPTFNDDVFAFQESILPQSFDEGRARRGDRNCRIVGRKADPIYFSALLRTRSERPRRRRAAECGQHFPPSDGDCHTPLPREARKGNDTTPRPRSLAVQGGQDAGCFHPMADIRIEAETQSTDSEGRPFYSITYRRNTRCSPNGRYGISDWD